MLGLTPGNLITHLRKLEDAGYVQTEKTGSGVNALTTVALTHDGRGALERYTAVLRQLLDTAEPAQRREQAWLAVPHTCHTPGPETVSSGQSRAQAGAGPAPTSFQLVS